MLTTILEGLQQVEVVSELSSKEQKVQIHIQNALRVSN